jgi:hypothetical protein
LISGFPVFSHQCFVDNVSSEKFVDCKKEKRKKAGGLAIIRLDKKLAVRTFGNSRCRN